MRIIKTTYRVIAFVIVVAVALSHYVAIGSVGINFIKYYPTLSGAAKCAKSIECRQVIRERARRSLELLSDSARKILEEGRNMRNELLRQHCLDKLEEINRVKFCLKEKEADNIEMLLDIDKSRMFCAKAGFATKRPQMNCYA